MNRSDQDFLNAALRTDLLSFLHRSVLTLNPGAPFLPNWHLDAIAYLLEQVRRGEITRLIINLPPRSLKSIFVSVVLPAFLLGHDPRRKIFGISYGGELAAKHASDFRSIVQCRWYRQAFPNMQVARMADSDVYTTARGFRKTTSVNATLTGLGGDCFIIDDPLKAIDAYSEPLRKGLNDWFSNTLISRLDNKSTGIIIVVMQRVHMNDLTGHLLEYSSGWTVLSLRAIAEQDERVLIGDGKFHIRRAGEALHPEREPVEVLEELRRELGSDIFEAQYQQAPVPPGGNMIKRDWVQIYDFPPIRSGAVIQSWDTAAKEGGQNDWSVCTTWIIHEHKYYLVDVFRKRLNYPDLRAAAIELARQHRPTKILIEDTGVGMGLIPDLHTFGLYAIGVKLESNKLTRMAIQSTKFQAGQIFLPRSAYWLADLQAELFTFPGGKHDDQIDSISQALANADDGYDHTYAGWQS